MSRRGLHRCPDLGTMRRGYNRAPIISCMDQTMMGSNRRAGEGLRTVEEWKGSSTQQVVGEGCERCGLSSVGHHYLPLPLKGDADY